MEAIIFCGIQASGKSTYYKDTFFKTHVRISLDLFNTRRKEKIFLRTCFETQQRFVIDNTNPAIKDRAAYIQQAKAFKFTVIGYYFQSTVGEAITRNKLRIGKEKVPPAGIGGTFKRLEVPTFEEGFDKIYKVKITDTCFRVEEVLREPTIILPFVEVPANNTDLNASSPF